MRRRFFLPTAPPGAGAPLRFARDAPWLAPLAGYSDLPFRLLCRHYGAAVCVTEMVSAKGLLKFLLPWPIPASIYGLVLLFLLLALGIVKLDQVKDAGEFLIKIMPPMFIPAAVGLIDSWPQLKRLLLPLCVIIPLTTILVMLVTGKVTDFFVGRKEKTHE